MQDPLPMAVETPRRRDHRQQAPARALPASRPRRARAGGGTWRLDAHTRRVGLEGVAQARAVLAACPGAR